MGEAEVRLVHKLPQRCCFIAECAGDSVFHAQYANTNIHNVMCVCVCVCVCVCDRLINNRNELISSKKTYRCDLLGFQNENFSKTPDEFLPTAEFSDFCNILHYERNRVSVAAGAPASLICECFFLLLQITRNEERQECGLQWQNAPTAIREYLLSSSEFKTDWPR
jgi:hypothetical protein